jgi:hypothetical protein
MFLTFTCNPKWEEVLAQLGLSETPNDCPNIVVKVFRIKLIAFLDDLTKHNVIGKVVS